jgi:hypothetical protein
MIFSLDRHADCHEAFGSDPDVADVDVEKRKQAYASGPASTCYGASDTSHVGRSLPQHTHQIASQTAAHQLAFGQGSQRFAAHFADQGLATSHGMVIISCPA